MQNLVKNKRVNIFGYPVDITTKEKAVNFVMDLMEARKGLHVVTINPEIILSADKNPELAEIIKQAELIIPESTGMMLAIKSLGLLSAEKIPGIEFSEALMQKCSEKKLKVAFLGGSPNVINSLNIEIKKRFPDINIVFAHHGYFEKEDLKNIENKLSQVEPHLLFVALGSPKQEFFIKQNKEFLKKTVMIGVGGSFDVWAKKVKRAPVFFRALGLEWFYRLITQPARFGRMFPALPLFFLRILLDRENLKSSI